jgi:hypothetical protein
MKGWFKGRRKREFVLSEAQHKESVHKRRGKTLYKRE